MLKQIEKPITVVYIKNYYLRQIENIAKRLKRMGAKIVKKSPNHGMLFVNTNTKKFKGKQLDMEEIWKVEHWV